ncbi:MAG: hypothetical protein IID39_00165 [Planctomycetes bacterium]|nr:hypothetical protein [Planctomycetota bacterium]
MGAGFCGHQESRARCHPVHRRRPDGHPRVPDQHVKDPTGAGDSFAGGTLGYLSSVGDHSPAALRRAIVHGTIAASFTIEAFSLDRVLAIERGDIDRRVDEFLRMLRID